MTSAEQTAADNTTSLQSTEHLNANGMNTLVTMNMPRPVLDYVGSRQGLPSWAFFVWLALYLMLFFALVLAIVAPLARAPIPHWIFEIGLLPRDAILVDLQLLSPILGCVLLAVVLSHLSLSLVTLLHRGFAIRAARLGIQRSANLQSELWLLQQCLRRINPALLPEEYLVAYHWASIRVMLKLALWILIPTLLVAGWETLASSYATPRGFKAGGMFAWQRPFVTWDEVEKLSTGAIDTRRTRYVLHYSGTNRDLANWQTVRGNRENLAVLLRINDELVARDVPWEVAVYDFGVHRGQPQWNIGAFKKLRAELSAAERSVFDSVYRYPQP